MKFRVYATVVGSKYLGEFEADSEAQAKDLAFESDESYISLCHQCSGECEGPEITEVFAEQVGESDAK